MKRFILLLLISFSSCLQAQHGNWSKIISPVSTLLRKLVFVDELNGWACGSNGIIIHTNNGGETWSVQNTNTNNPIIDICFTDNLNGWALSWELNNPPLGTYILKTNDGGLNWSSDFFPVESEFFGAISFINEQYGLVGERQTYYTSNGGLNWNLAERDSDLFANLPFYQINMLNDSLGFACGGVLDNAGIIWKTTNGGRNWKTNAISPDEIFEIFIFDSLNILALSGDPEYRFGVGLIKSSDGGESWSYEELPINAVCYGIDFRNKSEGWSAAGFKFLFTTDGGNDWSEILAPDSSVVYDVQFINESKGFACGQNGVLLKYEVSNDISGINNYMPSEFKLYQNYPNPFNPSTKISWQSPVSSWQTIKLYDLLGREIETITDGYYEAGYHSISYTADSKLPSGVYFYKLQVGNFSETKKMLLLR